MSPKSLPIAAFCCLLALCGCEKKAQEEASSQPVKVVRARASAPEGMALLGESGTVFITTEPLTVGEYVDYLRGTGQPVRPEWVALEPDSPEAARAVTGLDRREAERCATWHMKRLPTLQEWQEAVSVVGARPYPWLEDGQAVRQGAPILLIQDWRPKTQGDLDARAARAALPQAILTESQAEFVALRTELEALVTARRELQEATWREIKPIFFEMLDRRKAVAEAKAGSEGRALTLEVLSRLAQEKGKLAIALKAQDLSAEDQDKAVAEYARAIGELRNKVVALRAELTAASSSLQQEVVRLTRAVDEAGSPEKAPLLASAAQLLARYRQTPEATADVLAASAVLADARTRLEEAPEALAGVPSAEDLRAAMARLDDELTEATRAGPAADAVEAEKARLARLGESVAREFLQEGILLNELNELVALRAAKAALESRVEGLKEILAPQ